MTRNKANLAVLFADVAESTRLYEALGDTRAFGEVRECLALLGGITAAAGGRVVKTIGDAVLCVFPDANAAARAAREMQTHVAGVPGTAGARLAIRIGFHYGPVIEEGGDVFGDCVNVAARMSGFALAGQIVTTGGTVALLAPGLRQAARRIEALPVKGKHEEVDICELLWQTGAGRTAMPGQARPAAARGSRRLRLSFRDVEIVVAEAASLGRDAENTVVITDPMASRRHAKIELRRGKFVLTDHSTNGTFVTIAGGPEIELRREQTVLHGNGAIAFGHSARDPGAECVAFNCE